MKLCALLAMTTSIAACAEADELGEVRQELNGTNPGKVTTVFGEDYVNRCAVDPVGDLNGINTNPSYVISYWSGKNPGLPYSEDRMIHRQSIQRLYRGGVNFLVDSMSMESPATVGGFEMARMLDHPTTLRLTGLDVTPWGTPMDNDYVVRWFGGSVPRLHAGGMQVTGRFAVVGYEGDGTAYFQTSDLADPYAAVPGPVQFRVSGQTSNAGAVAMTRTNDDFFVVLVFGYGASDVEVFRSVSATLPTTAGNWISKGSWSTGWGPVLDLEYQNVQLITKCDGQLYALATHLNDSDEDWADLYRVTFNTSTFKPTFTKVAWKKLTCNSSYTGGTRYCDFSAGAGPFIDYNGALIIYGIEHYDDAFPYSHYAVKVREF